MSKLPKAGLLAGIVLTLTSSSLYAVDQKAIDSAIDKGVKALRTLQGEDGTWPYPEIGATALAGLTLLECGVKADDHAVVNAADAVRKVSPSLTHNYSICLAILFFDRLGDPQDIPLIESLTVRLLAGQTSTGGWSYRCPPIPDAEVRRLQGKVAGHRQLVGRRELAKPGAVHRGVKDLTPEIQRQLALLQRQGSSPFEMGSDNSNTQFATLALWIARRYGVPVDNALKRVGARFRASQHADGGWAYFDAGMRVRPMMARSTASMTCAGLLGLAVADGKATEASRQRKPDAKPAHDINKSPLVRRGLFALSTTIGRATTPGKGRVAAIPQVGGRTYYFLWSLERVAVTLGLKTIGKKDWYAWGAEILVANQHLDGNWHGTYAEYGADTCFALLFLKRANLVPDLTVQLAGRVKDPGERVLKNGDLVEGIALEKQGNLASGVEGKTTKAAKDGEYPAEVVKNKESKPAEKPLPPPPASKKPEPPPPAAKKPEPKKETAADEAATSTTGRMADDLAKSTGSRFDILVKTYRDGKGVDFTETLALTIPQLKGDRRNKVRQALAERLTRMKDTTLAAYLADDNLEIRIAAARAGVVKRSKSLIPQLIPLVRETRGDVAVEAHRALKELSGQVFGPKADATR
jgi:hypothetical protein